MHTKKSWFVAVSSVAFATFSLISQGLSAQPVQALSPEELQKINQQPPVQAIKNNGESGKATEVIVETPLGTRYEMSAPADAAAPNVRNQDVNRVPTIRMPF